MQDKPVALVTGANKGIGFQIAKDLAADPGFTATDLNSFRGTRTVDQGSRQAVRLALIGADGPTGTLSDEDGPLPW